MMTAGRGTAAGHAGTTSRHGGRPSRPDAKRGQRPGAVSARRLVQRLVELKNRFSAADRAAKLATLRALATTDILAPGMLHDYHEALLFLRAYPDDATIFKLACREAAAFGDRVSLLRRKDAAAASLLEDTGIVRTGMYYSYDYAVITWLVQWYGDDLEIDWDEYETTDRLDRFLALFCSWVENDGLDLADVGTREWIELGKGRRTSLRWFLENLRQHVASEALRTSLYDGLELPIVWQLGDSPAARTHAGRPASSPYYHHDALLRKTGDFRTAVASPLSAIRHASRREAGALIKMIRSTLSVRHRALYPVDYANPDEVIIAEVDRGYAIILFGMHPEHRLPIESDYGVLILKNGFIFGYGVGAMLFDQVEIAVNIFDTWRGGESRYVFTQFTRVFHHHFGIRRFKIERYQVGYDNEEGIQSGAFWFYRRLGFVPKEPRVQALAAKEQAKIDRNPSYRTPPAILEKLAESDLYLALDERSPAILDDFPLADLSLKVTAMIGREYDGDRDRAGRGCAARVAAALGAPKWKEWPKKERESFARMSLILALIPGLDDWPQADRADLVTLLRAKGASREAEYARLMTGQIRLRAALEKAARP